MTTALGIFFGVIGAVALHRAYVQKSDVWFIIFLISLAIVSLVIGGVI